nr:hypothetical protein [Tanacetum cinerariifolium]
ALQQIFLEYAFHKVLQQIFLEYAFHKILGVLRDQELLQCLLPLIKLQ